MGGATEARFIAALEQTLSLLRDGDVPCLVIGGVATAAVLSQSWDARCSDIDLLILQEHNERALEVLSDAGFSVARTDDAWIYKAALPDVTVDLIWRSRGDIRLDEEMLAHATEADFLGVTIPVPSIEDILLIKSIADVDGSSHFKECLKMLQRLRFDWGYLVRRADDLVAMRLLSLMSFAMSEGIGVPPAALEDVWRKMDRPVNA